MVYHSLVLPNRQQSVPYKTNKCNMVLTTDSAESLLAQCFKLYKAAVSSNSKSKLGYPQLYWKCRTPY